MKIRRFEVEGLNDRVDFAFDLHDDVNIFTGVNGSGKTTALKLAWYLISGNTIRVRTEIKFQRCRLVTDSFDVNLVRHGSRIRFSFKTESGEYSSFFDEQEVDSDGDVISDGEDFLRDLIRVESRQSIYFPTFRRIEGGYSISAARRGRTSFGLQIPTSTDSSIGTQLDQLSREMSYGSHKFVCAVSTEDIAALLTQRYAQISEGVNKKYTEFSADILQNIRGWERGGGDAAELLRRIQETANEVDSFRETALRPTNVLSQLVSQMFAYQGVKLKSLALGDAAKAIDSDVLSAGEKQMLSFLVYNAFATDTPIFIDEPELSLHPDWQRRMFPTLLGQQATNQFIISTHSPFIYSQYADKELRINRELGE